MTLGTPKTQRLDLRPETCPPLKLPHSQGPGYVRISGLFLGLFDVTRCFSVAASPWFSAWDGI